jgi:HEAT repeat protein
MRSGKRCATALLIPVAAVVGIMAYEFRDHLLVPWHLHVLEHGSKEASFDAASRLGAIRCVRAVPALIRAFVKNDPYSEYNAYTAAIQTIVDDDPERAVPLIAAALQDPVPRVRLQAAFLLDGYCPPDRDRRATARFALPELILALDDPDSTTRAFCVRTLQQIGPDASAAVERLERLCNEDSDPNCRNMAREAIRAAGGTGSP